MEKDSTPLQTEKVLEMLSSEGVFSRHIQDFEARDPQKRMLVNVVEAYNNDHIALIEAGTGTGKSMAYLLPAILWAVKNKQRTVISTKTINLQEQLINKDIPLITKALGVEIQACLVKGMSNYLCLRKLEEIKGLLLTLSQRDAEEIKSIIEQENNLVEGSKTELSFLPSLGSWERIYAESEACNNKKCPFYQRCFFFNARSKANDAQILVVNHHLLFADLSARAEKGDYTENVVLPTYKRVILDEAHHIEDIASDFFGSRTNRITLMRTLATLASDREDNSGKIPQLKERFENVLGKDLDEEKSSIHRRLMIDLPGTRRDLIVLIGEAFQSLVLFVETAGNKRSDGLAENKMRLQEFHRKHPLWSEDVNKHMKAAKRSESLRSFLGIFSTTASIIGSLCC